MAKNTQSQASTKQRGWNLTHDLRKQGGVNSAQKGVRDSRGKYTGNRDMKHVKSGSD